ncbi:photoactive yellow protein [Actimicrobium sp. GrIS 1.19]|uniref:PAS domain-containing protein n=1 Tax=Actimicrobium sp. GrIS 1.19 TaxID=3071708 RepID=UPI002E04C70E|nr:photoactive yellow protein [Actimicrobium sp. GrIS 1.19]
MRDLELPGFGKSDIEACLDKASDGDIDRLDFGAVEVDRSGVVVKCNATEGALVGCDPALAIGKNFFTDVAPCTATPAFKGVFETGVRDNSLNTMFEFLLDCGRASTRVKVHMKKALGGETCWIFLKPL